MDKQEKPSDNQPKIAASSQVLTIGTKGEAVKELQSLLGKKGYETQNDGVFGEKTQKSVREFQTKNSLKADGEVGPLTWESLRK